MTSSGIDPWSSTASGEERRASATLELALRRGLLTESALQTAIETQGEDAESIDAVRKIEIAVETGLLHPTAVARLEREAGTQASSRQTKSDPFDRLPVENWDRYELVDFIGQGGMGDVYRANDPRLGRTVAIKFLRRDDPDVVARFVREARIQSRVDHEGICPVYEVGEVEGHPFIVMQYVAGGALPEVRNRLSIREKAQIMADVAEALHAAHRLDLVHRDVKPANIMVELTPGGGWRPFVVDFGIAREIDTRDVTRTGAVLGTPAFAAPEQIRGKTDEINARSDIYSFGATFYWLLTGRAPFEGSFVEILEGHTSAGPTPPSRLDTAISRDLETIVLKCLEIDRDRRYASAFEVSEDLRRFLAGEPITARRGNLFYRGKRFARRHPLVMTVLAATMITVAATTILTLHNRWQSARRSAIAQALVERVNTIEEFVRLTAMMPRHDTSPEHNRIHRLVEEIRRDAEGTGELGHGPGRYALGRIHLVLGEVDEAVVDLQNAWDSGFQSPAVAAALGKALGRAYENALRRTRHISDPELRRTSEEDAARSFRDRALQLLQIAGTSDLESPAMTQALIAYYEGRFEAALESAAVAADEAPWDWRILKLSGDIRASAATRSAADGDVGGALRHLDQAGQAYEQALDIARSDADTMTALCHRWLLEMEVRERHGDSGEGAFAQAKTACATARSTAPKDAGPWETSALLQWRRADSLNDRGLDPQLALEAADQAARAAIDLSPDNAAGHHALGGSLTVAALNSASRGGDPELLLAQAIAHLESAGTIEPGNPVIADDLGYAYDRRARFHLGLGLDPREDLEQALAHYDRALGLSPGYANAHNNSGIAYWRRAVWELRSGLSPVASLDAADEAFRRALHMNPRYAYAWTNLGMSLRTRAQADFNQGGDPSAILHTARQALDQGVSINSTIAYAHTERAAVELTAARIALKNRKPPRVPLAAAATAVRRALEINPSNSTAWQTSAEVHRLKATKLKQAGASPRKEIRLGLADAQRALDLNPSSWQAMVSSAALHLLEEPQGKAKARTLLTSAVETNPLAEYDASPLRNQLGPF